MTIENIKCPQCNGKMVSRKNSKTGEIFWGCADFPRCKGTRDTNGESVEDRRAKIETRDDTGYLPSERQRQRDRRRW